MDKKMIMTKKLADELMNVLACVAISATGGAVRDEKGDFSKEQIDFAENYARETFCDLLTSWEVHMNKEWSIE